MGGWGWGLASAPAAQRHRPAAHASAAAGRTTALTGAQLARQLAAAFRKAPFTRDAIRVTVEKHVITISGRIVLAENRGIATRDARRAARAAHWTDYRVVNTLQVH